MSVSEHAVFACEFAGGGGDKRRSGGRKSSVSVWISASEFALYTDKQEFNYCISVPVSVYLLEKNK